MRRTLFGLLGISLVFILAGFLLETAAPSASTTTGGTWLATSDAPLAGRYRHTAIWTGEAMLVWGGYYHLNHFLNDGALYDPFADTWQSISTVAAPVGRLRHTAVLTGSHMIIWGGEHGGGGVTTNTGGIHDANADQWEATSQVNAPAKRQLHSAIWTGNEMIVWGGCSNTQGTHPYADGYRYDPTSDSWTELSSAGAPSARFMHTAVWTGEEMLIWGGCGHGNPCTQFFGDGARYDPTLDDWRAITTTAALSPRRRHTAVWGGDQMLVWGGEDSSGSLSDGAAYDPATDTWAAMSSEDAPSARLSHTAVWSGEGMIVWGGHTDTGAIYYPALDVWNPLPTENAPSSRIFHVAVWAEDRMVVWGGARECTPSVCSGLLDTGGVYIPDLKVPSVYLPLVSKAQESPLEVGEVVRFRGAWKDIQLEALVTESYYRPVLYPDSGDPEYADGIFVVALMDVTNHGLESDEVGLHNSFKVQDSVGRKFDLAKLEVQLAAMDEYERESVYEPIQPGFTKPLVFVFDVLPQSQGLHLVSLSPW